MATSIAALFAWAVTVVAAIAGAVCLGLNDHPWLATLALIVAGTISVETSRKVGK